MSDEKRERYIENHRWCPEAKAIVEWLEDQDEGCMWCHAHRGDFGVDVEHKKLVLAAASDHAWEMFESIRTHLVTIEQAEVCEPEEIVAQYVDHFMAAAKSKTFSGQVVNLVKATAVLAVRAIASARWARAEHEGAVKLRDVLGEVLAVHAGASDCPGCEAAKEVLAGVKLDDVAPDPSYDPTEAFRDLPTPDPPVGPLPVAIEEMEPVGWLTHLVKKDGTQTPILHRHSFPLSIGHDDCVPIYRYKGPPEPAPGAHEDFWVTKSGKVLTEADIEAHAALADEAEKG